MFKKLLGLCSDIWKEWKFVEQHCKRWTLLKLSVNKNALSILVTDFAQFIIELWNLALKLVYIYSW